MRVTISQYCPRLDLLVKMSKPTHRINDAYLFLFFHQQQIKL